MYDALDETVADIGALDLRSSGYAQMYKPSRAAAAKVITVTVTGPDGKRAASSYQSKVAKGRVVRALLQLPKPRTFDVAKAADSIGLATEAGPAGLILKLPAGWGLVANTH